MDPADRGLSRLPGPRWEAGRRGGREGPADVPAPGNALTSSRASVPSLGMTPTDCGGVGGGDRRNEKSSVLGTELVRWGIKYDVAVTLQI